jgi:hypothetical protein
MKLERLLQDDLDHLVDRLAAATPPGAFSLAGDARPDLRERADALEQDIATCRATLLLHYARWRESLDELEDLWALAVTQRGDIEGDAGLMADLRAA